MSSGVTMLNRRSTEQGSADGLHQSLPRGGRGGSMEGGGMEGGGICDANGAAPSSLKRSFGRGGGGIALGAGSSTVSRKPRRFRGAGAGSSTGGGDGERLLLICWSAGGINTRPMPPGAVTIPVAGSAAGRAGTGG